MSYGYTYGLGNMTPLSAAPVSVQRDMGIDVKQEDGSIASGIADFTSALTPLVGVGLNIFALDQQRKAQKDQLKAQQAAAAAQVQAAQIQADAQREAILAAQLQRQQGGGISTGLILAGVGGLAAIGLLVFALRK